MPDSLHDPPPPGRLPYESSALDLPRTLRYARSPCGSLERSNRRFASRPNPPVRTEANTEPKGTTAKRRKHKGDGTRQVKRCVGSRRPEGPRGTPGKSISGPTPPAPPPATRNTPRGPT